MPLLPLEYFRRELGYNPLHFFGLSSTIGRSRVSSSCNQVLKEYAWQDADAIGRDEIRAAIATAEDRLKQYLGYAVAPRPAEQTLPFPGAGDAWGRWPSIPLNDGYIQSIGGEARALIQATVAVTYSDPDGDGISELATITVPTTVTDPDQILVFFNATDRSGASIPATGVLGAAERYLIQPLKVSISGGTATIAGPSWVFVKPILTAGFNTSDLEATTASNYAATVDIYRRYTDPNGTTTDTSQAALVWETTPCAGWWCCNGTGDAAWSSGTNDPAALGYAIARAGIRDSRLGIVSAGPAAYDASAGTWGQVAYGLCRAPDRITVRYRAGLPLIDGQMQPHMRVLVARLAIAEMERPIGACADSAGRVRHRWQYDLAQSSGNNDEAYSAVSSADLDNPLGTRRGHVYAWREIRALRLLPGFLP